MKNIFKNTWIVTDIVSTSDEVYRNALKIRRLYFKEGI